MSIIETLAAGITCGCSQVHVTGCIGNTADYCALNENGCRDDDDEVAFSPFAISQIVRALESTVAYAERGIR